MDLTSVATMAGVGIASAPSAKEVAKETAKGIERGPRRRCGEVGRRLSVRTLAVLTLVALFSAACAAQAPDPPREALAAFTNRTNGFESQEDFNKDLEAFESTEDASDGLGPVYNHTSCVACHQNPVTGSSSQVSVIRAGFHKPGGPPNDFVFSDPPGGSLIHQRAINPAIQVQVPSPPSGFSLVTTLRMATTILGDGYIEVLSDEQILAVRTSQPDGLKGLPVTVVANVQPTKVGPGEWKYSTAERIGRFGWKCQEASLMNFSAGAYLHELGITSPINPEEDTSNGNPVTLYDSVGDPEEEAGENNEAGEKDEPFGEDVEAFARFMRSTMPPPRAACSVPADVAAGEQIFTTNKGLGCAVCHHPNYTTPHAGELIGVLGTKAPASDLPGSRVPEALANQVIYPYSDFMLHDIGTGDGIVQTQHASLPPMGVATCEKIDPKYIDKDGLQKAYARRRKMPEQAKTAEQRKTDKKAQAEGPPEEGLDQRTANMMRTAPLWGLHVRPQLLHDGSAFTIEQAILRHTVKPPTGAGPAPHEVSLPESYKKLSADEKRQLLAFLDSL